MVLHFRRAQYARKIQFQRLIIFEVTATQHDDILGSKERTENIFIRCNIEMRVIFALEFRDNGLWCYETARPPRNGMHLN